MNLNVQKLRSSRKLKSIFRNHAVELAYLFGSQLTRYANSKSDVDIAIKLSSSVPKESYVNKRIELGTELARFFHKETDVNLLQEVPLLLRFVATSEGRYLYESKKDAHVQYEVDIMTKYFDFLPTLTYFNKEYVKRSLQQNHR